MLSIRNMQKASTADPHGFTGHRSGEGLVMESSKSLTMAVVLGANRHAFGLIMLNDNCIYRVNAAGKYRCARIGAAVLTFCFFIEVHITSRKAIFAVQRRPARYFCATGRHL
jgi:hypothetical protein